MHIQSYLGDFNSFTSKQQRKMQNIFSNLNRSRKSLTKLYDQKTSHNHQLHINLLHKIHPSKRQEYAFDDNLFHSLYKSHLLVSHQRNNTISGKIDVSKLSFKLNYVQNHRPIIKQKIITRTKQKDESFNINFLTEPKTQLKIQTKRNNIEKFIRKNQDEQKRNDFVRSRKTKRVSIKEIFQKMQEKTPPSNSLSNHYSTLPTRQIQSSHTHYDLHSTKSSPSNRYHTIQKTKQKNQCINELPQYVKNIMKPCKIKGIQLIDRPLTMTMKKKVLSSNCKTGRVKDVQGADPSLEWGERVIKTARQGKRQKKYISLKPENEQSLFKLPRHHRTSKKPIIPQPWNIDINNEQEQQQMFIFNHKTIN